MDVETLRVIGKETIDRVCEYASTVNSVHVFPDIEPGYLIHSLPDCAPEKPEKWENIVKNFEKNILKGITHWQHNQFFAYVPSGSGFASLIGDLITDALAVVPITWVSKLSVVTVITIFIIQKNFFIDGKSSWCGIAGNNNGLVMQRYGIARRIY